MNNMPRKTQRLTDAPEDIRRAAELLRQTSGIANNINQITKRANSGEPVTDETLRLIADMQVQIWDKLKSF